MTRTPRTLDLDWADLELAFRDATGAESYIDKESGEVLTLVRGFDDEKDIRDKLKRYPSRFVRVVPVDKSFTRDVIGRFIQTQKGALKKKLDEAFAGNGGIARVMAVLHDDKPTFNSFSRFEQSELMRVVEQFLDKHGLKAAEMPPGPDLFEGLAS